MWTPQYPDGRPTASLRMDAADHGPVLKHGDGPNRCDVYGARDPWIFEQDGTYYLHYDGAGDVGWLCVLATSADGVHFTKVGPQLQLGPAGSDDAGSASYGSTHFDAASQIWHMFYVGTPNTSPPPGRIPAFPYYTMHATATHPGGPWTKQPGIVLRCTPGTYYAVTSSPGHIVKHGDTYIQFFSAATQDEQGIILRSLGIARTKDLNGTWAIDPEPILPMAEQVENIAVYYEPTIQTWFLFTNHIGLETSTGEYTDAIWVYWSKDINQWDPANKAVVLDRNNCAWSQRIIGLPTVLQVGDRLALYYDGAAGDSTSHIHRDVGLAWLDLPLKIPTS